MPVLQSPDHSSAPLAAAGIIALGLVPTLGGPRSPLHWAMTAGIVGFGVLLWSRHRAGAPQPLRPSNEGAARAGRVVLWIAAVLGVLVATIVGFRWHSGGGISALSLGMPLVGLGWLVAIGARSLLLAAAPTTTGATDRPSRRPARQDRFSPPTPGRPASPGGHISA